MNNTQNSTCPRWNEKANNDLKPNSITLAGSELVRSWFELDSVMEFGFEPASH